MNIGRSNPVFIVVGILLFLVGIWLWITPQVVGNIVSVITFFVGLGIVGYALGFRVQR